MKGALEYTEKGWRVATDTTRHHRERQWDYKGKGIYHITLTVAERYPLFGELTGDSPEGEKQIARTLREAGYPLIILLEKGFPKPDDPHYKFFKPSGVYFEACAAGKLLLVEPHPNLFELPEIVAQVTAKAGAIPHDSQRYRFLALNAIATLLAPSHV